MLATFLLAATLQCAVVHPPNPFLLGACMPASYAQTQPLSSQPLIASSARTTFGIGNWPPAGWKSFPGSLLYRPIPVRPRVDPRARAVIQHIFGTGEALGQFHVARDPDGLDYTIPLYFSTAADPLYSLSCFDFGGNCKLRGMQVHIPKGARPETGDDGHMVVIDQSQGLEFDFYEAKVPNGNGGPLSVGWGSALDLRGNGFGSNGIHSGIAETLGIVRPAELLSGRIDHALQLAVDCAKDPSVFPLSEDGLYFVKSDQKCPSGTAGQPAYGQLIWLEMSDAEIDALPDPFYAKALFHALAHYGAYVADTGTGGGPVWQIEGGLTYTSFGHPNPWIEVAARAGVVADPKGHYRLMLGKNPAVIARLRVLDQCVARGTCAFK